MTIYLDQCKKIDGCSLFEGHPLPHKRVVTTETILVTAEEARMKRCMQARNRLWAAVVAIWTHTVEHAEFVEGSGYVTTPHVKPCADPDLHLRLAAEEGGAWREYSEAANSKEAKP